MWIFEHTNLRFFFQILPVFFFAFQSRPATLTRQDRCDAKHVWPSPINTRKTNKQSTHLYLSLPKPSLT